MVGVGEKRGKRERGDRGVLQLRTMSCGNGLQMNLNCPR